MTEEIVWTSTRDGKKLEGLVRKPDGPGPFPAVILVSGLGMTLHESNNSNDEVSKRLIEAGCMTIQFSFSIFYPDGSVRELPLDERAQELMSVYAWVLQYKDTDRSRIGIHATSFGVATALAATLSEVKTYCFVSGAVYPFESITRVYTNNRGVTINYDGDTTLPRSSGENTTVGKEFWKSLKNFNQEEVARNFHAPVFVIHGDQDNKITTSDAKRVYALLGSSHKKWKLFIGGDHGINDVPRPTREEFLSDVVAWFTKTL